MTPFILSSFKWSISMGSSFILSVHNASPNRMRMEQNIQREMYALYEPTLPSLSYQMLMYDQPIVRALLESQNSPSLDLAVGTDYHPEGNFVWKFHRSLHIVSRFSEATKPSSSSASVGSAVRSGTSPSLCRQLLSLCYFRNAQ